jgi:predicted transcriptional regulator
MYVKKQQEQLESIRRGFAEIEAGYNIPHHAMKTWLLSLGSVDEMPPPKCVCGELHDERGEVQERK